MARSPRERRAPRDERRIMVGPETLLLSSTDIVRSIADTPTVNRLWPSLHHTRILGCKDPREGGHQDLGLRLGSPVGFRSLSPGGPQVPTSAPPHCRRRNMRWLCTRRAPLPPRSSCLSLLGARIWTRQSGLSSRPQSQGLGDSDQAKQQPLLSTAPRTCL